MILIKLLMWLVTLLGLVAVALIVGYAIHSLSLFILTII